MTNGFFNLHEAENLLPALKVLLHAAIGHKKKLEAVEAQFTDLHQRIHLHGGILLDHGRMANLRQEKDDSIRELREALTEIESRGCLVKDLDVGLVDFPCMVKEREIYLCWKLDEPHIGFWHDPDEGFAGRKPIDQQWIEEQRPDGKGRPN